MNTGRAIVIKAAVDIAARASAVITFPIVAHDAGASGYGAYTQMNVIVGFLIPFASLGLGNVMVRYFAAPDWTSQTSRQALRVGITVLGAGLFISALIALFAGTLNDLFLNWPQGTELFQWGSILVALGAVEFWLLELPGPAGGSCPSRCSSWPRPWRSFSQS